MFNDPTGINLNKLPTLLKYDPPMEGIQSPTLYIGMPTTTFFWQKEDADLYSVNYNHCGQLKIWYW